MNIKKINSGNFKRYGWIIGMREKERKSRRRSLFRIILTEPAESGWRIAYLLLKDKTASYLESHPGSFESFEPISGETLLYVCDTKRVNKIECFCLDKPVILKKGIWHNVVTLSGESEIKITENAQVKCDYWQLGISLNDSFCPDV